MCHGFVTRTSHSFTFSAAHGGCFTHGGRAVAVLNCQPLATSARLEVAVLLRSEDHVPPRPRRLESVLLKTWHFPVVSHSAVEP